MRKAFIPFLLMLTLVIPGTFATAKPDDKNALDYIPPDNFISGWVTTGNAVLIKPADAGYLFGESLQFLKEFDPVWIATETYTNYEKEMGIDIIQFPSASDAYGYYQLSPIPLLDTKPSAGVVVKPYSSPPPSTIDTIRSVDNKFLEGYKDRFYFKITAPEDDSPESMISIATYLLAELPGASTPADIIAILPATNLVRGSERYIKGPIGLNMLLDWTGDDILGFDECPWKAAAGEYRIGGGEYYLLVVSEYKDPDTARIAADRLQDYFQQKQWETVIVPAMKKGPHPRAFGDKSYAAFWSDGDRLWLIWDASDPTQLTKAIRQIDR